MQGYLISIQTYYACLILIDPPNPFLFIIFSNLKLWNITYVIPYKSIIFIPEFYF